MAIFLSRLRCSKLPTLLLALFLLGGCTGLPGSAPTQFYILKPAASLANAPDVRIGESVSVAIGPVQVPGYADRSQIVTFDEGSAIEVHDLDHWAEPLSEAMRRVLASNVGALLGAARVYPYPADFRPDQDAVQVAVSVIDVTQLADGRAKLALRWHVRALYANEVIARFVKTYETPGVPGDLNSYANGLSRLLEEFSVDIAETLAGLDLAS